MMMSQLGSLFFAPLDAYPAAFFKKVEWQPIEHSRAKTLAEIKEG